MTDIAIANKAFTNFMKRLKYYLAKKYLGFSLKYICVVETQKRGAIHYHVVNNIPNFVGYSHIIHLWNKTILSIDKIKTKGGSVKVQRSEDYAAGVDNVTRYLSKYLLKSEVNPIFCGEKVYFTSKNLIKPQRHDYNLNIDDLAENEIIKKIEDVFGSELKGRDLAISSYYDKYSGSKILFLEYKK